MERLKVVMVSYSNSLPFAYGLNEHLSKEKFELILANPAECARMLLSGEANIGLVPVAVLSELKDFKTITSYGIGAQGVVKTVALYSDVPINEIKEIVLDYQSRTSVKLIRVLADKFWNISPRWIHAKEGFENNVSGATGALVIGDRTFDLEQKHRYIYDLSNEWFKFTKLPFVFACWVAQNKVSDDDIAEVNDALRYGLGHVPQAIDWFCDQKDMDKSLITHYLKCHISHDIDAEKKKGLDLFLTFIRDKEIINVKKQ